MVVVVVKGKQKMLHGKDPVEYLVGHKNFVAIFVQILRDLDLLDDCDLDNIDIPNSTLDHSPAKVRQLKE